MRWGGDDGCDGLAKPRSSDGINHGGTETRRRCRFFRLFYDFALRESAFVGGERRRCEHRDSWWAEKCRHRGVLPVLECTSGVDYASGSHGARGRTDKNVCSAEEDSAGGGTGGTCGGSVREE